MRLYLIGLLMICLACVVAIFLPGLAVGFLIVAPLALAGAVLVLAGLE